MSTTADLTYASEVLTRAHENPIIMDDPPKHDLVHGFRVPTNELERRLQEREWFIGEYRADERELRTLLAQNGITPLGTAPKHAFEKLCDEVGLIRIEPDAQSRIMLDVTGLRYDLESKVGAAALGMLLPIALGVWIWGLVSLAHGLAPLDNAVDIFAAFVTAAGGVIVILAAAAGGAKFAELIGFGYMARRVDNWTPDRRAEWLRSAQKERVVQEWAGTLNNGRPVYDDKDAREPVAIRLPDPPPEVAVQLYRLAGVGIAVHVAAVPEAIMFQRPLSETLLKNKREHDALLRAMHAALDPIIYVERGSAVALVAQYGDFPLERQVVDRVAVEVALV